MITIIGEEVPEEKRCTSITKQNRRCPRPGIIDGMCVTHFRLKYQSNKYKKKKEV